MPTPMNVYAQVAAKYGEIDSGDQKKVDAFFEHGLQHLDPLTLQSLVDELLAMDGADEVSVARPYATRSHLPRLDDAMRGRVE